LFDLVQGLATEVLGLEHLGFSLLDEFADGDDVGVLEAVVAAHRKLKLFDRAVEIVVLQRRTVVQAVMTGFELFFEVDEDGHVVLQQLGGKPKRIGGKNGAVGPDLDGELVVVGDLAETGRLDEIVDLANGRMDGIHGNEAQTEVGVEVFVRGDVATASLEAHLHIDLAAFGDGADVDILVEDLNVAVGLDGARGNYTGLIGAEIKSLGAVTIELEGNLLQ